MQPEFKNTREDEVPTCDTRFMEIHDPASLLIRLCSYIPGGRFRLSLDEIYLGAKTAQGFSYNTEVLNVRVSDHSPVRISIGK